MRSYLDFEKPVAEIEAKAEELRALQAGDDAVLVHGQPGTAGLLIPAAEHPRVPVIAGVQDGQGHGGAGVELVPVGGDHQRRVVYDPEQRYQQAHAPNVTRAPPGPIRAARRSQDPACLASDDDGSVLRSSGQASEVARVAGENAVTGRGQEHDGGVDRIGGTRGGLEGAGFAAIPFGDRAHLDSLQQPGQVHLPTVPVAPGLGDDHRVGPQLQPVHLGCPEPGDHAAVTAVDGD